MIRRRRKRYTGPWAAVTGATLVVTCGLLLFRAVGEGRRHSAALDTLTEQRPSDVVGRSGQVAIRGFPQVPTPMSAGPHGQTRRVLYVLEQRHTDERRRRKDQRRDHSKTWEDDYTRWVDRFTLGPIEIRPGSAVAVEPRDLGRRNQRRWRGIPVDEAVTVVGTLRDGVISSGEPFRISPEPLIGMTRDAHRSGWRDVVVGVFGVLFGGLLIVIGVRSALRRLRERSG